MQIEHSALVDWVSFTIPREDIGMMSVKPRIADKTGEIIYDEPTIKEYHELAGAALFLQGVLPCVPSSIGQGRKGFRLSLRMPEYEPQWCYIYGGHPDVILVEITGQGCEALREQNKMDMLLEAFWHTLTRIDIAHDLKTDVRPLEFALTSANNRFKSFSHMESASGETCYIGSPKSDFMVRVYRYNEPNPRHEDLRLEYVFRRDEAKNLARQLVESGLHEIVTGCAHRLQWRHHSFQGLSERPLESVKRSPKTHEGTLIWLAGAVKSTIARLLGQEVLTRGELEKLIGLD